MSATVCDVAPSRPRAIRVDDDLWAAAHVAAGKQGTTVSAVANRALADLVASEDETPAMIAERIRRDVARLESMTSDDQ